MKKRILIFSILILVITGLYLALQLEQRKEELITNTVIVKQLSENNVVKIKKLPEDIATQPVYMKYHHCKPLLKDITKNQSNWRKKIDPILKNYLEEYDREIINKALVLLEGSFFTYRKRELLRKADGNSLDRMQKSDSIALIALGHTLPEDIRFSLSVDFLLSTFKLPRKERTTELRKTGLIVDEVIDAIRSKKFTNQQIIELMNLLVDINGFTHNAANYQPNDLLDGIIDARNEVLLNTYIELGGQINNRKFGVNSLERLLSTLNSEKESLPYNMVTELVKHNLPIRVSESENSSKQRSIRLGAFWTRNIRNPKDFDDLVTNLGLVLLEAPTEETLKEKQEVMDLYENLVVDKKNIKIDSLRNITENEIRLCSKIQKNIFEMSNFSLKQNKIQEAKELFGKDKASIIEFLREVDLGLVDCYLSSNEIFERTFATNNNDTNEAYRLVSRREKIYEGIQEFNSIARDANQNANFFWQIVQGQPQFANTLIGSGIVPQRNDFFWAARLSKESYSAVADAGFPFEHASPNQENLLKYAARQCNAELIDELFQREQPYTLGYMGNDALSTVLITRQCREEARLNAIKAVMNYEPVISTSHRGHLAYLRLMEYSNYEKVTDMFPQLKIAEEMEPIGKSCF